MTHTNVEVVRPHKPRGEAPGRGPALAAVLLALGAVCALAVHSAGPAAAGQMDALAMRNAAETQELLTIPGSGSVGVAMAKHSAVSYCTLPGTLVKVSPPDFFCSSVKASTASAFDALKEYGTCADPTPNKCTTAEGFGTKGMELLKSAGAYCSVDADCKGADDSCKVVDGVAGQTADCVAELTVPVPLSGSVDSCNDCDGNCYSPAAALNNRDDTALQDAGGFVGWNPQGGPENNADQYIDFDLGGRGATITGLLWANAGDTDHDPATIKVFSSDDGVTYTLVDTVDSSALQGSKAITALPVANADTRAKFWRINPGGIANQSIPRVMGLCNTADCKACIYDNQHVPEQGFNMYGAIKPAKCEDGEPNGYIYCQGDYDSDKDLNAKLTKSWVSADSFLCSVRAFAER